MAQATRVCPECRKGYPARIPMCPEHGFDLVEADALATKTDDRTVTAAPPVTAATHVPDAAGAQPGSTAGSPTPAGGATPAGDPGPGVAVVLAGASFPVPPGRGLVLGRFEELQTAEALTPFDNVSRVHCRVFITGGSVFVEDLGSTNGTWVDGRRIAPNQPTRLTDAAALRLAADVMVTLTRTEEAC